MLLINCSMGSVDDIHSTNSNNNNNKVNLYTAPKSKKSRLRIRMSTYGGRACGLAGRSTWNAFLNIHKCNTHSLSTFRRHLKRLKTFLRATAGTAIARLSHRNSVCPSVRLSVTRVDQAKTVQARIIKSSPSAAPKTLVSGPVTLFQKFHRGHPNRGP